MKRYLKSFAIALVAMLFMNTVKAYTINGETNKYGGTNTDSFSDIVKSSDGGYVAVGETYSTDLADGISVKLSDGLIVKYNSNGEVEWQQVYGDEKNDSFNSVVETDDGFVAVGYVKKNCSSSVCNNTAVVVKYDKEGKQLWKKDYAGNKAVNFNDIIKTSDGGFITVGVTDSTNIKDNTSKGSYDALIVKYDKDGNVSWQKLYGGSGADYFRKIIETDDGYITVGDFDSTTIETGEIGTLTKKGKVSYTEDALIVKYDKSGNVLWQKNYGGSESDSFYSITATDDGFVVVGDSSSDDIEGVSVDSMGSDAIIVKYDNSGNILWQKNFGAAGFMHNERFNDVIKTDDGGILITGYITSNVGNLKLDGARDGIVIKYNKDGKIEWQKNFDGGNHSYDELNSIIELSHNKYVAVGKVDVAKSGGAVYDGLVLTITFKYEITKEETTFGSFDVLEDNGTVEVVPKPDDGFVVKDVVVKDSKGNNVPVKKDNGYYFELSDDVTVSVTFEKQANKPSDGTVIQIKENPNTGDYITKYIVFFGISFTGIIVSLFLKHKFIK